MTTRILKSNREPSLLIVDLFCGAGGTSTGFTNSGIAKVIACVNHDAKAINSHWANHPDVEHFTEDMRTLDLTRLIEICRYWQLIYPNAKLVLWASLECTNFSKAKGGMARDADSRTLADHLHRYITAINPDYVMIENVVEFRDWGPCRVMAKRQHANFTELKTITQKKTKKTVYGWVPVKELKGTDFKRWCSEIDAHGYSNDWRELNSANFGAFTSRNRLFGMFVRPGLDFVWPEPTHSKKGIAPLLKWNAVKEKIDFDNQGYSIFDRGSNMDIPKAQRKDLVDPTFERVYAGLIKFVAGGKKNFEERLANAEAGGVVDTAFLSKYYGGRPESRNTSLNEPCSVIPVENRHALVKVYTSSAFIKKYFSGRPEGKVISVNGPLGAIRCIDGQAVVQPQFMVQRNSGKPESKIVDINGPARVLTSTGGNQDVVNPSFISVYHGNGHNCHSVNTASPVIPTKDGLSIVNTIHFIYNQYTNGQNSSIDDPLGSILNIPKANMVQCQPFIANTHFGNGATSIEEPLRVITADRHYAYLVNPGWGGNPSSVHVPSPVIVARQDKAPLYLVVTEQGYIAIEIFEHDTPIVRKIKLFMAMYGIIDIKMRMLEVQELKEIQGFPKGYRLDGSKADQKKFIGNSVNPDVVDHWARAIHYNLTGELLMAA